MYKDAREKLLSFLEKTFDMNDAKVKHKLSHTFFVVENSSYLGDKLGLSNEDVELAKLIALFHDFGRFYEARDYKSFREELIKMDHASLSVKLLFDEGLIREFVSDNKYDSVMRTAIGEHSKYILDTSGMSKEEELHSKLIRDADKLDTLRSKIVSDIYTMANITEDDIINSIVSDNIFNDFMNEKTILSSDRKTGLDIWVSYIAFIFGLYFKESLDLVREKGYVDALIDRFNYSSETAHKQMEMIRKKSHEYLKGGLNEN